MSLPEQNLEGLDVTKLTPLDPEVLARQATINFGTIGHVAHGKSTVVRAISGVETVRFKNEKQRNITIRLGYANAKIFKCTNEECPPPGCYTSTSSDAPIEKTCDKCGHKMELKRHISFVDCPGHDILMATMLNGAAVMDAALLLVAGNEKCPQPQTSEHLAAVEILGLSNIIIVQNKVELLKKQEAEDHRRQINDFIQSTKADGAPIVPVSAVLKYNTDALCEYICTQIPVPPRNFTAHPKMIIVRSFDVNRPGEDWEDMRGGVAGGSITEGVFRLGDEVEIRPGQLIIEDEVYKYRPLMTKITSMYAENNELKYCAPGGLIAIGTTLDPAFTRSDKLVGQVMGHRGHLPDVYSQVEIRYTLFKRLLGLEHAGDKNKKSVPVESLSKDEHLKINIGSTSTGGNVLRVVDKKICLVSLVTPVCAAVGDKVAISRRVEKHFRLIGWGEIVEATKAQRAAA